MNNLPQRYTALVSRRPELAVDRLEHRADQPHVYPWLYRGYPFKDDEASPLIFRRLCEAMPHAHALVRMFDKWAIATVIVGSSIETSDWHPDPLSALFAFWEAQP